MREGAPGFADDEEYISNKFYSFERCYKEYVKFNPHRHWVYLRSVQNEYFIYENNEIKHKNLAKILYIQHI